jgi:hypothetical protein
MSVLDHVSKVTIDDLSFDADSVDPKKAAEVYKEHGALIVRGLQAPYLNDVKRDIEAVIAQTLDLFDQAVKVAEGWKTPNGALLLPAPEGFKRDKQLMTLPITYMRSAAFLQSALDETTLDIAEAILGPDIELKDMGQSLVKEPVGGHPKNLHQDAAYFEHKFEGPVGVLNYVVDTPVERGALHVVPGSHSLGVLDHIDTFSHLGLDPGEWPWERALPLEGKAGDSIFFHVKTIHGSKPNTTDVARPVYIHRYRAANDYVVVSATTEANRAEAEKRRDEATKENQEGLLVRGFRRWEAARQK